jgi:hypothetical protein
MTITIAVENPVMVGLLLAMLGLNIGFATKYLFGVAPFWVAALWLIMNLVQFGWYVVIQ